MPLGHAWQSPKPRVALNTEPAGQLHTVPAHAAGSSGSGQLKLFRWPCALSDSRQIASENASLSAAGSAPLSLLLPTSRPSSALSATSGGMPPVSTLSATFSRAEPRMRSTGMVDDSWLLFRNTWLPALESTDRAGMGPLNALPARFKNSRYTVSPASLTGGDVTDGMRPLSSQLCKSRYVNVEDASSDRGSAEAEKLLPLRSNATRLASPGVDRSVSCCSETRASGFAR